MNVSYLNYNKEGIDLVIYECGIETCKSKHSYGPAVRDHYLIHYVMSGEGTFYVDGKVYVLHKGQGFLICPHVVTYYEADSQNPWEYAWIGFNGVKAESYLKQAALHRYNPIFTYDKKEFIKECLLQMIEARHLKWGSEVRLQGLLYVFLSELIEVAENHNNNGEGNKELYIKKFIQYVEGNYSRQITIKNAAEYLGLNRSYFSYIFKCYLKQSPQAFLIQFRIKKACELLGDFSLSVGDIGRSVGYEDSLAFSKSFKKIIGCSPTEYRNR